MPKSGFQSDWLEELKARLDIVDVVSRYVPLEQKGRNFWGRCPFHHEKTPSFAVNPERQAYKCFGCGAGGDAIKFIEEMERADFMEACRILADRVGYTIPDFNRNSDAEIAKRKERKTRLLAALKEAARFYHASLSSPKAAAANAYLKKREIPPPLIKRFGLGFSPGWEELVVYLGAKGFTCEELADAGLAYERNGKWLDSLAGRLIFPVIDNLGNVVAFGGRLLEDANFAKYKNTAQTEVFDKSKTLYAINLVKKLRQEQEVASLIVVEGYMDAISLYGGGFMNVVASMGTSLTVSQASLIKRMVDKVYISYDGDGAGQKATIRGLDILKSEGLDVYVVELPEGQDPDDVIRRGGAALYQKLLDAALPLTDFKLKLLKKYFDLSKPDQKRKYVLKALEVVGKLTASTEREDYLKQIKADTGFTYESLRADMESYLATGKAEGQALREPLPQDTGADKAIRFILCEMIRGKPFAKDTEDLASFAYNNVHRLVYEYLRAHMRGGGGETDLNALYEYVGEEGREELDRILASPRVDLAGKSEQRYYEDCVGLFKRQSLQMQIDILTEELGAVSESARRDELAKMIQENLRKLQQFK